MTSVSDRRRDSQFHLRAGSAFAPYVQLSADTLGALTHPPQAKVSRAAFLTEQARINADAIIPHAGANLPYIILDFHFDPACMRVVEGVAQCFARNSVNFIPQHRMQVLGCATDSYRKISCGAICRGLACPQFLTQYFDGLCQIVGNGCRRAQILNRIACLGNGFSGVIDRSFQYLLRLCDAAWEQVLNHLKTRQEPMEALQERVMQIAGASH